MKYHNLEPPDLPPRIDAVWKWAVVDKFMGRRRQSPHHVRVPTAVPDEALIAGTEPSLTWIGHATWLIRLGGRTILTDPNWSSSLGPGISRNVEPPLPLDRFKTDIVLISHNHRDHLDAPTVKKLGAAPIYVVPEGLGDFFRKRDFPQVIELPWWQTVDLQGLKITFVPAQHWSQRGLFDRNRSLWGGFVVEKEHKVYFAGDTAYFNGFQEIGRRFPAIDAALLPIGAYDPEWFMRQQHMNPEDALRAFLDLGARLLCAMHWATFKLTDEPLDEPAALLEQERGRGPISIDRIWVPAVGESRRL